MTSNVKCLWFACAIGLFLFVQFASAQTLTSFEGKIIADIQYQPSQPLAQQDLDRVQPLKKGAPLHLSDVATAIDNLFATGYFTDIQVDAEPSGDNAVVIKFLTHQAEFIGHVEIAGKLPAPPNRAQLTDVTQLNLGQPYDPKDLAPALAAMKKLLIDDGLFDATLSSRLERDASSRTVNFVFLVSPGKRAKYATPVIEGKPLLSDATILRATGWRIPIIKYWRHVTQAETTGGLAGIQKKYQRSGHYTADIKLDSLDYNQLKHRAIPHLTLNGGPKVQVRAVEAKISQGKLRSYVPIFEEGAVDRDLLVEGARNLRDYFQAKGYYDVTVDFRNTTKDKILVIEYVISLGTRYKLVSVVLQGNKFFKTSDLRDRMFLEPASLQYWRGRYSQAFLQKDEESISNIYKANGFRDVKVTSTVENDVKGKAGDIGVVLKIDEGPGWFVDDVKLEGVHRLNAEQLFSLLTSVKGQVYSEVNIASDRNSILTQYFLAGFPNAAFQYNVTPSDEPHHVKLVYRVQEGDQQFVRNVMMSGLTITRPRIVDKYMTVKPGQPLSLPSITAVQRRLYQLGIFAEINTAMQDPDGDIRYKNVLYDFQEAHRYTMNVGVGAQIGQLGTTTTNLQNPGGTTGFSPRGSFDISRLNFLGIGDTLSFRSSVSNIEQRASIEFLQPRFMGVEGRNITYTILYDNARDVLTFASKREEASVQISQKLSKSLTANFRYAFRRVSTSNVVIPSLLVPQLLEPVRIGMLSANFVQDRRDNPADAHRGIYNVADIALASSYFGSQRNFARVLLRNATYTPIGSKLVFARQTQFGIIQPYDPPAGVSANDSVPLPERFYGGGPYSDRAFGFNQAGPRDIGMPQGPGGIASQPTGFPIGGNALFFNTFELRFPLIGSDIGGVFFHDAGNVYTDLQHISFSAAQHNDQDFNYMVHAVGFGIRYKTPVGPLRLDLAYAINPPSFVGFKGTQLQLLSCNPALPPTGVCVGVPQQLSHFQFSFAIGQAF